MKEKEERKEGGRRNDIDLLRVTSTYLLFLYHTIKIFDVLPFFHIKHAPSYFFFDVCARFFVAWHMPLLFVVAGWSLYSSFQSRTTVGVIVERIKKLFVPLLFGMFVICPYLRWVELKGGQYRNHSGETVTIPGDPSFLTFTLNHYYTLKGLTWAHLWFLIYLFTFTLVDLPLLQVIRRLPRDSLGFISLTFAHVPMIITEYLLREKYPGVQNLVNDWANFWLFNFFVILGFLIHHNSQWEILIRKKINFFGFLSGMFVPVYVYCFFHGHRYDLLHAVLRASAAWYSILYLFGFAARYSTKIIQQIGPSFFSKLSESAFSAYLLHQFNLTFVAFHILHLSSLSSLPPYLSIPLQFILILSLSIFLFPPQYFILTRVKILHVFFAIPPPRKIVKKE